jgi:thiamine transport system permease protein
MGKVMDRNRSPVTTLKHLRHGLLFMPLVFLGLFYFYPLLSILWVGIAPNGTLDLGGFQKLVTTSYFAKTLWFTFWQAAVSTVLVLVLAIPSAYVFTKYTFTGKKLLLTLSMVAFLLPTVVVSAAFTSLVGPRGLLNTLLMQVGYSDSPPIKLQRTITLILLVHIFYNFPLALRMISSFWENQSNRIEEAARILGCHGWRLWWLVRLPFLRPIIMATTAIVFLFTFTSFGVILILGGPRFATLEVEIYRQAIGLFDLPVAAALSILQIGAMLVLLVFYTRFQRQIPGDLQSAAEIAVPVSNTRERIEVSVTISAITLFLFTPLLSLVLRSITQGSSGFTLRYYLLLFQSNRASILPFPPVETVVNSLLFAAATALIAVTLGLLAATLLSQRHLYTPFRWLDPVFMLPLATSAVTLGFGFIIALDKPPLNLRTSPALIPIAHTLVALPFVVRNLLPAMRRIPERTREAAQVLGASSLQVWSKIDLPLIWRSLIVSTTFAFIVSMGEFGASMFIVRPDVTTMPVAIYRLLDHPGAANYGQAMAMSVLLMIFSGSCFAVIERLQPPGSGEF